MHRPTTLTVVVSMLLLAATSTRQAGTAGNTQPPATAFAQESGKQIFHAVCAQCHTVRPPANLAPPMSHVARHYLLESPDAGAAAERIAAWLREPAEDRSLLDGHAIEMWGLMPPVALAEDQARAVAEYVVTLADSAVGGMMGRRGMMGGMGMGRGMMGRDTTMGQGMMRGMGMGRGMMGRDTTMGQGMMRGMGMGRGMMGRDTLAVPGRYRGS